MSFLLGKRENVTGPLASQYAGAYSKLLAGKGDDPFTALFQSELGPTLAQAKESAGNLTGSSLGNIMGSAAGRSLSQFLLGILGQGASFAGPGTQQTYTPGFLDYLFSAVGKAAPAVAGLFSGGATATKGGDAAKGDDTAIADFLSFA